MVSEASPRDSVLSHRIADSLRAAILDDEITPGSRIRQEEIAARFGASRIPVREAIRMLHADGLVTLVANSGAWVTELTLAECSEHYRMRERVEPLLLRSSMENLDDAAIEALQQLADDMESNSDVGAFIRLDRRFHLGTYAGAGRTYLREVVERLWNTTQHYRRAYSLVTGAAVLPATHMEHQLLVDCLRRRDPDDAERILVTHIRRTRLELEKHPDLFA